MSEVLKTTITANKCSIYICDKTGKYKRKQNDGGWGSPNLKLSHIIRTELVFTIPEILEPLIIDVTGRNFPNDDCECIEITAAEFGLEEITSGVWKIERYHYFQGDNFENFIHSSCRYLFTDCVACCIDDRKKQMNSINLSGYDKETIKMDNLLENARYLACSGLFDKSEEIVEYLRHQCKCS